MVGLLISINYMSGLVWNGVEHFLQNQPFQNGISQLLAEAINSIAHCCKWEHKTKT